jgi:hypothetical protein
MFSIIRKDALYERPIPERHRIVFYLGHLEAFDWNLICAGAFGMESVHRQFDQLFAFGIDPTNGQLPDDQPRDWPREAEILLYNSRVRKAVDVCLQRASDDLLFHVAIEHRLMHAETLAYMLHWLPLSMKRGPVEDVGSGAEAVRNGVVEIPAGVATLGLPRNTSAFGWDNEFEAHEVPVPAFGIDRHKVSNSA